MPTKIVCGLDYFNVRKIAKLCCNLILKALDEHTSLLRNKIDDLILEYLPKDREERLNKYKVGNLLAKLKRNGKIDHNDNGEWTLVK